MALTIIEVALSGTHGDDGAQKHFCGAFDGSRRAEITGLTSYEPID